MVVRVLKSRGCTSAKVGIKVRSQLEDEVRSFDQIAKHCGKLWLRESGTTFFPRACMVGREVGWEQARLNERCWLSDDSMSWKRNPRVYSEQIAIDVSFRGIAVKYAACGWAVVQMDHDGGLEPWYELADTRRCV